jgi:hypothetical protein
VYWRAQRPALGIGFTLSVVPLWFAWRSLTTYFFFVTLPALVLALADLADEERDPLRNEDARPLAGSMLTPTPTGASSAARGHTP